MQRVGIQFSGLAVAALALVGLWTLAISAPAGAATSCDRVASISGSDAGTGSVSSPFRSAQHLVDSLTAGQTGCFRSGIFDLDDSIDVRQPSITLTSFSGERATLKGELGIEKGADGVTVRDLNLDGRASHNIGPMVYAANTTFDGDDVTNHNTGICFILGAVDPAYGRAVNTVIENSRIHNCGQLPAQNGDHGIYAEHSDGAIIRNNWIYDNADRGIQLFPDSQRSQIYGNVIDGNGEGIIISDDSSNNAIYHNVVSNSNIRRNIESSNLSGTGNVVHDNCVWATNSDDYYNGDGGIEQGTFTTYGNVIARPQFVNAAAGDFTLQPKSPCAGGQAAAVTLQTDTKEVRAGSRVRLHGHAAAANQVQVKIQILRHGHWRKFARSRLRANGKFTVRRRLGTRLATRRARLRAKVPRLGRSRAVVIRVR